VSRCYEGRKIPPSSIEVLKRPRVTSREASRKKVAVESAQLTELSPPQGKSRLSILPIASEIETASPLRRATDRSAWKADELETETISYRLESKSVLLKAVCQEASKPEIHPMQVP
jgi:hypothetical protein